MHPLIFAFIKAAPPEREKERNCHLFFLVNHKQFDFLDICSIIITVETKKGKLLKKMYKNKPV